jgi:hypothetical protein
MIVTIYVEYALNPTATVDCPQFQFTKRPRLAQRAPCSFAQTSLHLPLQLAASTGMVAIR